MEQYLGRLNNTWVARSVLSKTWIFNHFWGSSSGFVAIVHRATLTSGPLYFHRNNASHQRSLEDEILPY